MNRNHIPPLALVALAAVGLLFFLLLVPLLLGSSIGLTTVPQSLSGGGPNAPPVWLRVGIILADLLLVYNVSRWAIGKVNGRESVR